MADLTREQAEELRRLGYYDPEAAAKMLQEVSASAQEVRAMMEAEKTNYGIAGKAHGLVYGERAKTYGHPRFDFTSIGKVWTGLLQDLLRDGAEIDPYRVAVLMTGLKLARLVKSPQHHDSRVDTIGYMLTMERLDEPEELITKTGKKLTEADIEKLAEEAECGEFPKRPEGLIEGSGVQGHPRPLKDYIFPIPDGSDPHQFRQKVIHASSYEEAKREFEEWNTNRLSDNPVLNPLTGKPLEPGEVVASLGEAKSPCSRCGHKGPGTVCDDWKCPGRDAAVDVTHECRDDEAMCAQGGCEENSQSPTETSNPSDEDVKLAFDILKRRQDFHDREAAELLASGGGFRLGTE